MTAPNPEDVAGILVSEYETFARLPEWILDADVSDRAVRLFAVLLRHADKGGSCFPSRGRLAQRLRCSTDSVDRAVKELVTLRALRVEHHGGQPGEPWRSNSYTLLRKPAGAPPPSRTGAATPSRTGAAPLAARVRNEREPVEREPRANPSCPTDVGRTEPDGFPEWYEAYPRHEGRKAAAKAYAKARRSVSAEALLAGALRYRHDPHRETGFTAHPATWLNQGRWDDEPLPPRVRPQSRVAEQDDMLRAWMDSAQQELPALPAGPQ